MRSTAVIALAFAPLFSSAAIAEETPPPPALAAPAEALANEARAAIAEGSYEAGITKLNDSYQLSPKPEILFEMAVAYSQWQGHCQDAISTFDRFFQECHKCSTFEAAKERLQKVRNACSVKVRIESKPSGAMISIDGSPIGASPLETTVIAGRHAIEAELSGFGGPATSATFVPGQTDAKVEFELSPLPAFIEFRNVEPESVVLVSGVPARPPKMEVQPGRHKIEASRPGFESKTIEIVARRGETATVDLTLEPSKTSYRTFMWASVGVGAFALLSTGAFGLMAREASSDLKRERQKVQPSEPLVEQLENRISSRKRLAAITGGVAGAAAISAVIFFLIEPDEETPPVALGIAPDGLVIGGTF